MSRRLFELGRVVITANCQRQIAEAMAARSAAWLELPPDSREMLTQLAVRWCLERHQAGDWGETGLEDAKANRDALRSGARLVSVYRLAELKVWVITDAETDACPSCSTGLGLCEPNKGEWVDAGGTRMHFRTDVPARRLSTTILLPADY
jgi:hypothetical protein